ncbi:hypothetical protein BESB_073470 [Besnoitia besnoiti]|uniref:Pseudouridine synthase RsuA/RluA-like domain-containing protein n=1 Tax=Besnoitia besnoiti TaxID=94643 RepID=A0A2A9M877_BESBE|nr:uncharacterized protein BESB_073470 [Besnoitia besnoiti]PFH34195.1 hypothetical protein BESB_073470 [Besnoitia besnoiti]
MTAARALAPRSEPDGRLSDPQVSSQPSSLSATSCTPREALPTGDASSSLRSSPRSRANFSLSPPPALAASDSASLAAPAEFAAPSASPPPSSLVVESLPVDAAEAAAGLRRFLRGCFAQALVEARRDRQASAPTAAASPAARSAAPTAVSHSAASGAASDESPRLQTPAPRQAFEEDATRALAECVLDATSLARLHARLQSFARARASETLRQTVELHRDSVVQRVRQLGSLIVDLGSTYDELHIHAEEAGHEAASARDGDEGEGGAGATACCQRDASASENAAGSEGVARLGWPRRAADADADVELEDGGGSGDAPAEGSPARKHAKLERVSVAFSEEGKMSLEEAVALLVEQPWYLCREFRLIYEDANLLIVAKPFDVRVDVPLRRDGEGSFSAGGATGGEGDSTTLAEAQGAQTQETVAKEQAGGASAQLPGAWERRFGTEFTVADWYRRHWERRRARGVAQGHTDQTPAAEGCTVRLCHQLDYATSGLLMLAHNQRTARIVQTLLQRREIRKEYLALVYGHPAWTELEVHTMIAPHATHAFKMMATNEQGEALKPLAPEAFSPSSSAFICRHGEVTPVYVLGLSSPEGAASRAAPSSAGGRQLPLSTVRGGEAATRSGTQGRRSSSRERGGKCAVSRIRVLRKGYLHNLPEPLAGAPGSLVKLSLLTGRRHQLRVHCEHVGHSIVGDAAYGCGDRTPFRMFLHATSLQFRSGASWAPLAASAGAELFSEFSKASAFPAGRTPVSADGAQKRQGGRRGRREEVDFLQSLKSSVFFDDPQFSFFLRPEEAPPGSEQHVEPDASGGRGQ